MKAPQDSQIHYTVIRGRSTVDIIIERDGSVLVRAPEWADDDQVASIAESEHYWIYQSLAEWRDLNATRVLREYKNGEGFLCLGRAYRLLVVSDQDEALQSKTARSPCAATSSSKARLRRQRPPSATSMCPRGSNVSAAESAAMTRRWAWSQPVSR